MNCAIKLQPLLSGNQQKDEEWLMIQRVVFFADQKAFSELTIAYQPGLKRMLTRFKSLDAAMIEDLVQETFLRAYLSLSGFNAQSRFSTWLYRIAYNLAIDHFRKKRIATCSMEYSEELVAKDHLNGWELQRDLVLAMKQLSAAQQQAVLLCYAEGYSHSEAADKLQLPLGTVKTHIMRAKKILEKTLQPWMVNPDTQLEYQPL
ncbi:MAG: sigma-70 family RNA polymerase sigma factor [Cellvibrio sp.]|nr:sigma-70 family RNA polymerase sigma factor [Cellvibrio sp.]